MFEVEQLEKKQEKSKPATTGQQFRDTAQFFDLPRFIPEMGEISNTLQFHFKKIGAKYYFPDSPDNKHFTKREYKVFCCYLSGFISAKNIGDKLFLSHRTIEFHFANILKKLGCKSKFDIRKQAQYLGLLTFK